MTDPVDKFYQGVVDEVTQSCRELFLEEGVDESVLTDLKQNWQKKITECKVFQFSPSNRKNAGDIGYGIISPVCSNGTNGPPELFVPSIHLSRPRVNGSGPRNCRPSAATIALPHGLYNQQIRDLNNAGISLQRNSNGHFVAVLPTEQQFLQQPLPGSLNSNNPGVPGSDKDKNTEAAPRSFPSNFNLPPIRAKGSSPNSLICMSPQPPLPPPPPPVTSQNVSVPTTTNTTTTNNTSTPTAVNSTPARDHDISPSTTDTQTKSSSNPNRDTDPNTKKDCTTESRETESVGNVTANKSISGNQSSINCDNLTLNSSITNNTETNGFPLTPHLSSFGKQLCYNRDFNGHDSINSNIPLHCRQTDKDMYFMSNSSHHNQTSEDNVPSSLEDFLDDLSGSVSQSYYPNYVPPPVEERPKFPQMDTTNTTTTPTIINNSNSFDGSSRPTLMSGVISESLSERVSSAKLPEGQNIGGSCQLSEEDMKTIEEILQMDGANYERFEKRTRKDGRCDINTEQNVCGQFDGEDNSSSCSIDDSSEGDNNSSNECDSSSSIEDEIEEEIVDIVESDPLNTADDDSDADICAMFESENIIVCQYVKVSRIKNKWKFQFQDGIMNLLGRDLLFSKSTGDAEW